MAQTKVLKLKATPSKRGRNSALRAFKIGSSNKDTRTSEEKMLASNDRNITRLKSVGEDYKNKKDAPKWFDKLAGTLNVGAVAGVSLVNNLLTDDDVNIGQEMVKSVKGERAITGSDLIKNLGVHPDTAFGKFALGAAGLAVEIGLDPLTYLTFGYGAATKLAAARKAVDVFDTGLDVSRATKLSKYMPDVAKLADTAFDTMSHGDQFKVWKAILRETGEELGDKGGIKLALGKHAVKDAAGNLLIDEKGVILKRRLQPTLLNTNGIRDGINKLGGDALRENGTYKAVTDAAGNIASLFTPWYKDVGEHGYMGAAKLKAIADGAVRGNRAAVDKGIRESAALFAKVDEDLRSFGTIAHQAMDEAAPRRMAILDELEGEWWSKLDEMDVAQYKAKTVGERQKAAQWLVDYKREEPKLRAELTALVQDARFDPARFKEEVIKLGGAGRFSDEQLDLAAEGFGKYADAMRNLRTEDIATNLANRKLGDRGLYYVKGMDGKANKDLLAVLREQSARRLEATSIPEDAAFLDADIQGLDEVLRIANDRKAKPTGSFLGGADAYKHKDFDTIEQRLKTGSSAETDIMKIMAARIEQSGKYQTRTEFMDGMAQSFGKVIDDADGKIGHQDAPNIIKDSKGVTYLLPDTVLDEVERFKKAFNDPETIKEFKKGAGFLTRIWKSQATATPGFFLRNGQSNYFLAMMHGKGDLATWKTATEFAFDLARGKVGAKYTFKGRTFSGKELVELLERNAVLGGQQMKDVAADAPTVMSSVEHFLRGNFGEQGGRGINKVLNYADGIHAANSYIEDTGRIAVYMQSLADGLDERTAAQMVDKVLYTYERANLTAFEQSLKDLIPFYTWMRRNLPNQVQLMLSDPKYLSAMGKMQAQGDSVTGNSTEWGIMPEYMRDMGAIPIPMPNGKKMYLNPNWGWQDIQKLEVLSASFKGDYEPLLKEFLASVNPFVKLGAEFAFNKDAFFGDEIVKHEGHLVKAPWWTQNLEGYFKGQAWWESFKSGGGAYTKKDGTLMVNPVGIKVLSSVPILANIGRLGEPGEKQAGRWLSIMLGLKMMGDDSDKWKANRVYEDRDNLRAMLDAMKDRGVGVPDHDELDGQSAAPSVKPLKLNGGW